MATARLTWLLVKMSLTPLFRVRKVDVSLLLSVLSILISPTCFLSVLPPHPSTSPFLSPPSIFSEIKVRREA